MKIPILAPVCAGSSIPDDWQNWQIKNFREIREVPGKHKLVGIPVNGDSLNNLNIIHGDLLIVKLTNQYHHEKLCVWQTPFGRTAKYVRDNRDGTLTLHNKANWEQDWQYADVELIGVVVRIERDI